MYEAYVEHEMCEVSVVHECVCGKYVYVVYICMCYMLCMCVSGVCSVYLYVVYV